MTADQADSAARNAQARLAFEVTQKSGKHESNRARPLLGSTEPFRQEEHADALSVEDVSPTLNRAHGARHVG